MWFNSKIRRTLPTLDMFVAALKIKVFGSADETQVLHGCRQLVSRVGLSPITSATSLLVAIIKLGTLKELPVISWRKVGRRQVLMALTCWLHVLQWYLQREATEVKQILKRYLSWIALQLECMKLELLVIVDRRATVNAFPGLVHTARHHGSWFYLKAGFKTLDHGIVSDWGEVVTR